MDVKNLPAGPTALPVKEGRQIPFKGMIKSIREKTGLNS